MGKLRGSRVAIANPSTVKTGSRATRPRGRRRDWVTMDELLEQLVRAAEDAIAALSAFGRGVDLVRASPGLAPVGGIPASMEPQRGRYRLPAGVQAFGGPGHPGRGRSRSAGEVRGDAFADEHGGGGNGGGRFDDLYDLAERAIRTLAAFIAESQRRPSGAPLEFGPPADPRSRTLNRRMERDEE